MSTQFAALFERYMRIPPEQTVPVVRRLTIVGVVIVFVLLTTLLVAFEDIFPGQSSAAGLQIGDIARQDIHAPASITYISDELTQQRRQEAVNNVPPVFDPPDPNVARRQTALARQILDFIDNVRRDTFATTDQKLADLSMITALRLDDAVIRQILTVDDAIWQTIDEQVIGVLERVMRDEIREMDVPSIVSQLPLQVSVRSNDQEAAVIVAIATDLIRPNTFENPQATEQEQIVAAQAVAPVQRSFERGQIVVREGTRIETADYEALDRLGILRDADLRLQNMVRALLATLLTTVILGLYIVRFRPALYEDSPRFLALAAAIFLIVLTGARFLGIDGQIYIYPTAALALLFVSLFGIDFAVMGVLSLAILVALMMDNSLEIMSLTTAGGLIGILTLRRTDSFNSYFFAGLVVALANMCIVILFHLNTPITQVAGTLTLLVYSLFNGILSAAAALAGMFVVTQLSNLPTSLKLLELSRPNQPLLQRLLREAPGTYQHSLQVANLSEQAANAIGANADLLHVAALYHDIGKMLNPSFFVENQADGVNPHNALNDPYRSADIIIGHVTEGEKLARQYRLPARLIDFIVEHHGTTQVVFFYRKAVEQTGDEVAVNIEDFTYPGPKPQSRESGILMLADNCESTVRARRPTNKQEIYDIINDIIETKTQDGQLDDCGLTLGDLKTIQRIFVEMLQAVFHPRINYPAAPPKIRTGTSTTETVKPDAAAVSDTEAKLLEDERKTVVQPVVNVETETQKSVVYNTEQPVVSLDEDDADTPLSEVPPLKRTGESRIIKLDDTLDSLNGVTKQEQESSDEV